MKARGYTIVEIIVVIGIIALIAAIVFPAFSASRAQAHTAVCTSNLRQIGMAMDLYQSDYGTYPTPRSTTFDSYIGHTKFFCPATNGQYNFAAYQCLTLFTEKSDYQLEQTYFSSLEKCFDTRGPDFPLIADMNHMPKIMHADDQLLGFAFVYRVSGAVDRVSKQRVVQITLAQTGLASSKDLPCDATAQNGNL